VTIIEAGLITIGFLIFAVTALSATVIGAVWLYNRSRRSPPPAVAGGTPITATPHATRNNWTVFFQMILIVGVTYTLLFLFPWGSTPPGELTASILSKEAQEMLAWFLQAGVIVLTLGAMWLIFNHSHAKYLKTVMGWIAFLAIIFLSATLVRGWTVSDPSIAKSFRGDSDQIETGPVNFRRAAYGTEEIRSLGAKEEVQIFMSNVDHLSTFVNCYIWQVPGDEVLEVVRQANGMRTLAFDKKTQEKMQGQSVSVVFTHGKMTRIPGAKCSF